MSIQTSEPGFTLKHLNPDDYHEIVGLKETFKLQKPDYTGKGQFRGFKVGDSVVTIDGWKGRISGFAVEDTEPTPFARIKGRLYHCNSLTHA